MRREVEAALERVLDQHGPALKALAEYDGESIPELIEPGYERLVDHGKVQTLWYPDGQVALRHVCDRSVRPRDGRTIIIAPFLQLRAGGGHSIVSTDPVTVTPSCGCSDCGLHGFLTDGVWRDC